MTWPAASVCPAAAVPMAPKMPAPITAPMASMIRSPAPNARLSALGWSPSITSSAIGLRAKSDFIRWRQGPGSDEQRREHQRDGTEQLDQHVQRGARRVLERIADRVADHRRLVGLG